MDSHVVAHLRRQHGLASRSGLLRLDGVTPGQIDGWLRRGILESDSRGVVRARGAPDSPEAEAMGAVLRGGFSARLIGPRAMAFIGVRGFARTDPFGVLISHSRRLPANVPFEVFRDPCPDDGLVHHQRIPLPRPARLSVEMARFAKGGRLVSAIDAARWERRPTMGALQDCLDELPSRYGPAGAVRRLVRSGLLAMESAQERRMVEAVGNEFGPVEVQVNVTQRRRVDAYLRRWALALEYLGQDHRTHAGRLADQKRDEELAAVGIQVIPVYAEDLANPPALRARIRRAVQNRAIQNR